MILFDAVFCCKASEGRGSLDFGLAFFDPSSALSLSAFIGAAVSPSDESDNHGALFDLARTGEPPLSRGARFSFTDGARAVKTTRGLLLVATAFEEEGPADAVTEFPRLNTFDNECPATDVGRGGGGCGTAYGGARAIDDAGRVRTGLLGPANENDGRVEAVVDVEGNTIDEAGRARTGLLCD